MKVAEDEDYHYLMLEICDEGDLYTYLKSKGSLSEGETRQIGLQLMRALQYLHARNIMHRDLKLGNILRKQDKSVGNSDGIIIKLCDFGLAIQLESGEEERQTICGTPNYISPEVLSGESYGAKTDIWSFGCLLYALLAGHSPFQGQSVKDTLKNIRSSNQNSDHNFSFLKNLPDVAQRPSANQVMAHPFFSERSIARCIALNVIKPPIKIEQDYCAPLQEQVAAKAAVQSASKKKSNQQQESEEKIRQHFPTPVRPKRSNTQLSGLNNSQNKNFFTERTVQKTANLVTPQSPLVQQLLAGNTVTKRSQQTNNQLQPSTRRAPSADRIKRRVPTIDTTACISLDVETTAQFSTGTNNSLSGVIANSVCIDDGSVNSILVAETRPTALSTERIESNRFLTKNGFVEINDQGLITVEACGGRLYFEVEGDGQQIKIYKKLEVPLVRSYTLQRLPQKYYALYEYAKKICEVLRERTPKINIQTAEGKFVLTHNQHFRASFKDGNKVQFNTRSNTMLISTKYGLQLQIDLHKDISLVSKEIKEIVMRTLRNYKLFMSSWA